MKYEIEVVFKRPKFKDRVLKTSFNLNYNDETFRECENMIRDHLVTIGNEFIDKEFYP